MPELIDRDQEHLRLLMVAMAGFIGFFSLFGLLYVGMGAMFLSGAMPQSGNPRDDPRFIGLILAGMGSAFVVLGLTFALLTFLAGRSLRDRRRKTFIYVVAGLGCLHIPWGTGLGVATFMVLGRPSVKALFDPPTPPPPIPVLDA